MRAKELKEMYRKIANWESEYRKELFSFIEESFASHKNKFELKPDGYETWEELCEEEQGLDAEDHIGVSLFPYKSHDCVELYPTRIYRKISKNGSSMYYADGYDIDEDSFPTNIRLEKDKASLESIARFINKCLEQESGKNRSFDKNEYVYVVGHNGESFEGIVSCEVTVDWEEDAVGIHRLVDGYASADGEMIKADFVYKTAKGLRCPRCGGFLYHEHHEEIGFLYYCPECKEHL